MTERLYYDNPYLTRFDAVVLEIREKDNDAAVRLNRSAFYPTSGGQPHDTGLLGGLAVKDVYADADGGVWHIVEGNLTAGNPVAGEIDWPRRFDHMQQHAGEHMLAGALWRRTGGHTIGLHLGGEVSTIDVAMPDGAMRVEDALLDALEDEVNDLIQRDIPIRCWFPDKPELMALPLRKPPAALAHVRVVQIGEEMVACGGTHPSSSGQIGLLKILDARPSKGKMRVSFVCGMRAVHDYRARANAAGRAAALLSTAVDDLPDALARLQADAKAAAARIHQLRRDAALASIDELAESAEPLADGWRILTAVFDEYDMKTLRDVASALIEREKLYALLASRQEDGYLLLFARSDGSAADMGKLLGETARAHGGKGGGRPDFAQGSARDIAVLDAAREKL